MFDRRLGGEVAAYELMCGPYISDGREVLETVPCLRPQLPPPSICLGVLQAEQLTLPVDANEILDILGLIGSIGQGLLGPAELVEDQDIVRPGGRVNPATIQGDGQLIDATSCRDRRARAHICDHRVVGQVDDLDARRSTVGCVGPGAVRADDQPLRGYPQA